MPMYVHDRMLELMEAEGLKTLFGIPDPSFVGMFLAAEARGWRVIAPHHEQAGAEKEEAQPPDRGQGEGCGVERIPHEGSPVHGDDGEHRIESHDGGKRIARRIKQRKRPDYWR